MSFRVLFLLLTLSGCDALGSFMAQFIPPLELMNDEWTPVTMNCDTLTPTSTPRSCIAKTVKCGDVIEGYSGAGRRMYKDEFYVSATCTTMHHNYDGAPEMLYKLVLDPQTQATAKLDSDCVDLDVFAMMWNDRDDACPKPKHARRVGECQMDVSPRGGSVTMSAVNKPVTYLVGVTGKQGVRGNFRLSIKCGV